MKIKPRMSQLKKDYNKNSLKGSPFNFRLTHLKEFNDKILLFSCYLLSLNFRVLFCKILKSILNFKNENSFIARKFKVFISYLV